MDELAQIVIAGGTLVSLLAIFTRKLFQFVRRMDAMKQLIEAQLTPNGGSSLLDKVDSIQGSQEEVKEEVTTVKEEVTVVYERLEEGDQKFQRIEKALRIQPGA